MKWYSYLERILLIILRRRGFFYRGLLCWIIGCFILLNDEVTSYDTRFQIRGTQPVASDIVIIKIKQSDITNLFKLHSNNLASIKEIADMSDNLFWNKIVWNNLLNKVLQQNPRAVGIVFNFSEKLIGTIADKSLLNNSKIIWASKLPTSDEQTARAYKKEINFGYIDFIRDEDGIIRKLPAKSLTHKSMVELLSNKDLPTQDRFINYRESIGKYTTYSAEDALIDNANSSAFRDKIVIIGSESVNSTQFLTPLGSSDRPEIAAQMTDTLLNNRIIFRFPYALNAIGLFLLMIVCLWIMTQYPQTVATAFMIWLGLLTVCFSAWIFDSFYYWTPAVSCLTQIAVTWIVFIGYQANKIERNNWHLRQEKKYLRDLEQLKNNFVSLISHDLKTPIAKINSVAERLKIKNKDPEFVQDIQNLLSSGDELNKYIQSIIKVLRVESKDFRINKEVCDINEIILAVIKQLSPLAAEKRIEIYSELEPMFSIEADIILIHEVVLNLLENAIKYTKDGGKIHIQSCETNHKVRVSVKDNGEGIKKEEMPFIWHKFVRGKDQTNKTKGTGLGLYLVKYFIELHGGEVFVESEPQKGTIFSFTLPLEEPQA